MSSSVAVVIATFVFGAIIMALSVKIASRRREAKEEELKQAASMRGWQFEGTSERGYRVHRWIGTTEGVKWRAESLHATSNNSKQHRPNLARWHGEFNPGVTAPIVVMGVPNGKEIPSMPAGGSEGFLAKLAQKAIGFAFDKIVDLYFGDALGKEVDAGAMHRVDSKLSGFVVMAINKDEGARVLSQGLERSLLDASNDQASVFGKDDRPWILLLPNVISLARTGEFRDLNEVETYVRAGVALTRVNRFAQRTHPGKL
jgi:hypothetical protein